MTASARTFRVFVSSTFADLKGERNALAERVFPRLRALCEAHGCRFQAIDLRWGVSEEAALDQQTMRICLEEIARCRRVSPRPNFIVLLGNRYGWQPLPSEIPVGIYERIATATSETGRDLMARWYRRDSNAVPATYCLAPRTGEFAHEDVWTQTELALKSILRDGIHEQRLPQEDSRKLTASATEQEIVEGALRIPDAGRHVFCYIRELDSRPISDESGLYWEVDPEAMRRLEELKGRLAESLPDNIRRYDAGWRDQGPSTDHLDRLCEDVYRDLSGVILSEIALIEDVDHLDREVEVHAASGRELAQDFVGRKGTLALIRSALASSRDGPLLVWGPPGCGKSSVMAVAAEQAGRDGESVVRRFIGASPGSCDPRELLEGLCRQISRLYGADESVIPADYEGLASDLQRCLSLATHEKPLAVFIDGLDQLQLQAQTGGLRWLPNELPPNVGLAVSSGPGESLTVLRDQLAEARQIEVPPIGAPDGKAILDLWLSRSSRLLSQDQERLVLDRLAGCPVPLYLRLAFEEARLWRSYDPPPPMGGDIPGLLTDFVGRLAKDSNHGRTLVYMTLGYLSAARNGLTEDELLDVLWLDADVRQAFVRRSPQSPKDVDALPVAVWARLRSDLEPYLAERSADGTALIRIRHHSLSALIRTGIVPADMAVEMHLALARYFGSQRPGGESAASIGVPRRRLSELLYQYTEGGAWLEAENLLLDAEFVEAKCADPGSSYAQGEDRGRGVYGLLEDVTRLRERASESPKTAGRVAGLAACLADQLLAEAGNLRRHPEVVGQQLHNRLADVEGDPVVAGLLAGVEAYYERTSRPWFREVRRASTSSSARHRSGSVVLSTEWSFTHACLSGDGKLAATVGMPLDSVLGSIALWDLAQSRRLAELDHFENVRPPVSLALFPGDKRLLVVWADGRGDIWDVDQCRVLTRWQSAETIRNAGLSADGRQLVTLGPDFASLRDPLSGEVRDRVRWEGMDLTQLAVAPDGTFALLGGCRAKEPTVIRLDIARHSVEELASTQYGGRITAMCLSPDGRLVACGDAEGSIHSISTSSGFIVASHAGHRAAQRASWAGRDLDSAGHTGPVRCLSYSSDGVLLASGSGDPGLSDSPGELLVWSDDEREPTTIGQFSTGVCCLGWRPGGGSLLTGGQGRLSEEPLVRSAATLGSFMPTERVLVAALSPNGDRWAVAHGADIVTVGSAEPMRIAAHAGRVMSVAWDQAGTLIVSGGKDGKCRLWDARTGVARGEMAAPWPGVPVLQVAIGPGEAPALLTERGVLIGGPKPSRIEAEEALLSCFSFSGDGNRLAIGDRSGGIALVDIPSGRRRSVLQRRMGIGAVAFAGVQELLWLGFDGCCGMLDPDTGTASEWQHAHAQYTQSGLFCHSALGNRFLSYSMDLTCRLWSSDSLRPIAWLPMENWPAGLAVGPGNELVIIDSMARELRFRLGHLAT